MDARRGFVPEDERNFSPEALQILRTASRHVCYLINEGYDLKSASAFVGNHYVLSERQRLAIMRSVATDEQMAVRMNKQVRFEDLTGKEVWIDGFNTIITLEVILSDSICFSCMDGTIRDLAALRGTYRLIPETDRAVQLLLDTLKQAAVKTVRIAKTDARSSVRRSIRATVCFRALAASFRISSGMSAIICAALASTAWAASELFIP